MARLEISNTSGDRALEHAVVADVVAAIEDLAGEGEVWIGDHTVAGLGVAGGPDWFFVGFFDHAEGVTLQALASEPPARAIQVLLGGQPTTLEPRYLLPLADAKSAAEYFLEFGAPHLSLAWEGR